MPKHRNSCCESSTRDSPCLAKSILKPRPLSRIWHTSFPAPGDYQQALAHAERALAIRQQVHPPRHPKVATCLLTLSGALMGVDRNEEALKHARESLEIYQARGTDHPYIAEAHQRIARILIVQEQWLLAAAEIEAGQRINRGFRARVLPSLSETEQLEYLDPAEKALRANAFLAFQHRQDQRICELSAGWLINGKAIGLEALSNVNRLQTAEAQGVLAQLRQVRGELARLSARTVPAAQQDAYLQQLQDVELRQSRLIRQIGSLADIATQDEVLWISTDQARQSLPQGSLFVDIVRVHEYTFTGKIAEDSWGAEHYMAWIMSPDPERGIQIVDLGECQAVDAAVREARTVLQLDPKTLEQQGEIEVERQAREKLQHLAKLVLAPIEPYLKDSQQLIVSPDALLWLVPWSALPLTSGEYLVERMPVQYINSGRDLAGNQTERTASPAVIFADPAYDSTTAIAPTRSVKPLGTPSGQTRSGTELSQLPNVARLPATIVEAKAIQPSVDTLVGQPSSLKTGECRRRSTWRSRSCASRNRFPRDHACFRSPPARRLRTCAARSFRFQLS